MFRMLMASLMLLFPTLVFSAQFMHPLDFKGSESEKRQVIAYIENNVKETYTNIGMGDPATLRMMENEELSAFKDLTKADNRKLLDSVIKTYCNIGMCNYSTILMMYNEQLNASKKSLSW